LGFRQVGHEIQKIVIKYIGSFNHLLWESMTRLEVLWFGVEGFGGDLLLLETTFSKITKWALKLILLIRDDGFYVFIVWIFQVIKKIQCTRNHQNIARPLIASNILYALV